MSFIRRLQCAVVSLLLTMSPVSAQMSGSDGRISGVVRDGAGAPMQSAIVTARNATSGIVRSTTTTAAGSYTILGLTAGSYSVSATRIGYRRSAAVDVTIPSTGPVDLVLVAVPLQGITVTATLREQALADVPFSVAAPTARTLRERGADNLEGVAANVAGFTVQNLGPGQSQVAIRGASSGQIARDQPGVKEQVGAYLDDAPISLSLFTPDLDLFDVSRVEVLRGPQGTLFGAGSLAGTVRYISNQPELGLRSVFGEVGGNAISGGTAGGTAKFGVNQPLGDRAALRVAAYHNQMGGFMDAVQPGLRVNENVNTGTRSGVRAAVKFAPTARLSVTPRVVFQSVETQGWNRIDAFNILANPFTTGRQPVTLGRRQQFTQIEEPFTDRMLLGDLNVRYDMGRVSLASITSYTSRDVLVVRDAGALTSSITGGTVGQPERVYTLDSPLDDKTDTRVLTQELRVSGGNSRARWLAGAFYSRNEREYAQRLNVQGFTAASKIPTRGLRAAEDVLFYSDLAYSMRQTALFGEGTVSVTPRLDVTAGLRWFDFSEDREQFFDGLFGNDDNGKTVVSVPGSTKANGLAPRVIASFKASDMLTFNAQAARGFRLGGINDPLNVPLCTSQDLATFSGRNSWKNETAWNYEVGAKSRLAGGRASLNVSAFRMDITDLQLIVTAGSCSSRLVFNVPQAVSQGAEFELEVAPSPFVDLSLSATLNDSELRSTLTSTNATGQTSVVSAIQKGNRLPSVPQVQAAAAATVRRPVRSGTVYLTGTVNHVGSRYTQIEDQTPGIGTVDLRSFGNNTIGRPLSQGTFTFDPLLPAYTLANARLGLTRANYEVAFFVNNIGNERALLALDRERGLRARVGYLTNQPRTGGVSITFNR